MTRVVPLPNEDGLDAFRPAARALVAARVPPEAVIFEVEEGGSLLAGDAGTEDPLPEGPALSLPRAAADLAGLVAMHRDPERYGLLYRFVWRIATGERRLTEVRTDPLVHRLETMAKGVRRDLHKMHAFLRFRKIGEADGRERFVAWFEPDHLILRRAAKFFVDRFGGLDWTIHTPDGSARWEAGELTFGPGGRPADLPEGDGFEEGWKDYYASTFNPARANPRAMLAEMPRKYWRNMPETHAIPQMLNEAPRRAAEMVAAAPTVMRRREPAGALEAMHDSQPKTIEELNRVIAGSAPFVTGGTRAVLGEGPVEAELCFVGEQPGDQEDLQGHPFVGPAGQLLDRALRDAGIERGNSYLTNAVKHFKFEQRGKRRLHKKPTAGEVKHYRWWLMKELELVRPGLVVALGATAALALTGKAIAVSRARGPMTFGERGGPCWPGYVTVHPSFLLRLPDEDAKKREYSSFVHDLQRAHELAAA